MSSFYIRCQVVGVNGTLLIPQYKISRRQCGTTNQRDSAPPLACPPATLISPFSSLVILVHLTAGPVYTTKESISTMTLLSCIFGKQAAASTTKNGDVPDLFGSKIAVPLVMHKAPASTKKRKGRAKANGSLDDETEKSSFGISSSDEPSSCTPQQHPTPEEDGDSQTENIAANNTKKTKARSKSEEEEEKRRTIFVGNLPPDISRRSLAGIFKPCGNVASSRLRSMAVAGVKLPPEQAGNQVRFRERS